VVVELSTPAATVDGVIVLVRAAVERLVAVLAAAGRQPAAVALTLAFDDGRGAQPAGTAAHTVTRELRLPCPLDHAAPIAARCRAVLLRWPLPAAVCGLRVAVTATAPLPPRDRRWNGLV